MTTSSIPITSTVSSSNTNNFQPLFNQKPTNPIVGMNVMNSNNPINNNPFLNIVLISYYYHLLINFSHHNKVI